MSLMDTLSAIGNVTVGTSDAYPVLGHLSMTDDYDGPPDLNGTPVLVRTWRFKCLAKAAANNQIGALAETLKTQLVRRGQAVSFVQFGAAARTMPATGGTAGSMKGYPRTSINLLDEESVGSWQTFELVCVTHIPQPQGVLSGFNLCFIDVENVYSKDNDDNETIRQSGTVRVRNDQSAKSYIETIVLGPAKTAATTAGHTFTSTIRVKNDAATATYDYVEAPQGSNPGSGIEQADVTDITTSQSTGRIVRVISGSAKGANATTFATAQEPTPAADEVLTAREVSLPSVPDGRVTFRYELLTGIEDASFPGIRIFGFSQTITPTAGGRRIESASFASRLPHLWKGVQRPWFYTQRTRIEFIGDWDDAEIAPLMDEDNLMERPVPSNSTTANGLRVSEVTHVFIYDDEQTVPEPYEIPAL